MGWPEACVIIAQVAGAATGFVAFMWFLKSAAK